MPVLDTKNFSRISYEPEAAIEFPRGLPGFEERRQFVALQFEDSAPLIFFQSVDDSELCFITLPVLAVDAQYRLEISREDLGELELPVERQPAIGEEILCVAVIAIGERGPTANLLAPIVVNLRNRKAVQAVAAESEYSHQHVLVPDEAPVC